MMIVRWTNLICGTLLLVAALGFLFFLPSNLTDFAREPEDVWLAGGWITLVGLIAALCFFNTGSLRGPRKLGWRTIANSVAVIAMGTLLVLGYEDPAVPPLLLLCAIGPVVALLGSLRRGKLQQPEKVASSNPKQT